MMNKRNIPLPPSKGELFLSFSACLMQSLGSRNDGKCNTSLRGGTTKQSGNVRYPIHYKLAIGRRNYKVILNRSYFNAIVH